MNTQWASVGVFIIKTNFWEELSIAVLADHNKPISYTVLITSLCLKRCHKL